MKDTEVRKLTQKERARQKRVVNLIASENYTSRDVREALASEFTNKYAEGYPGARYYGGNEVVDELERLTQARALKLFKLSPDEWHVNVQPLSGSPANLAVYYALMAPFGKIMGLELSHGGHLTHGHKVSATGRLWTPVPYTLDPKSELLNYSAIKKIARKEKPDILVAGYTAYPRIIDWKKMRGAANAGGALLMADISHIAGLIAGSVYPSPFPYVSVVTTTTHKTLRGPRAALIFTRKDGTDFYKRIDKAIFPGLQGGPHMNTIAGVAVALREANTPNFKKYARQVVKNARTLANELKKHDLRLVSGGTDTHLILVDTWRGGEGIGGKEASERLEREGIVVNKNTIPFDARSPQDPSGIRIGAAAETTRGKKEEDMVALAQRIAHILS